MSLLSIVLQKEKTHWGRMLEIFGKMTGIGGKVIAYPIIVLIISIAHYSFAFMHTSFEIYLYMFNRKQFELNLNTLG